MKETQSEQWADIVFEKRNKEYGAYVARVAYPRHLVIAIAVTLLIAGVVLAIPSILRLLQPKVPVAVTAKPKVTLVELGAPPALDHTKPPPPKITLPPPVKRVIKFVPPKPTLDDIDESMRTDEEIRRTQTGTQDVDGSDKTDINGLDGIEGQGDDAVYTFVDQAAEFPGGPVILARFVSKHMVYPKPARRAGIEGVVHVGFIVGKAGVISDVEIVKGLSPECDAEAIRVVKLMPPWRPAIQGGVAVRSRFVLPLRFKLGLVQNQ